MKDNFEESLKRLEEIVENMSDDELELDKAIELFEKGMNLSKSCSDIIKESKLKVNMIIEKNGLTELKPFLTENGE